MAQAAGLESARKLRAWDEVGAVIVPGNPPPRQDAIAPRERGGRALQERIPGRPQLGVLSRAFQRGNERSKPHEHGPCTVEIMLQSHLIAEGPHYRRAVAGLTEES